MHLTVVSKDSEFKRTKIPLRIKIKRHLTAGTNQEQLKSNKRKKKSRNNEEIRNIHNEEIRNIHTVWHS
jgi:hypothetical protein